MWSSTTAYALNAAVQFNGASYISIQPGTNNPPNTSPTFWSLLAQAGSTGVTGAPRATGPAGTTGAIGAAGPAGAIGPTGPAGPAGTAGVAGLSGATGAPGPKGRFGKVRGAVQPLIAPLMRALLAEAATLRLPPRGSSRTSALHHGVCWRKGERRDPRGCRTRWDVRSNRSDWDRRGCGRSGGHRSHRRCRLDRPHRSHGNSGSYRHHRRYGRNGNHGTDRPHRTHGRNGGQPGLPAQTVPPVARVRPEPRAPPGCEG
jgi:hypothetical protein